MDKLYLITGAAGHLGTALVDNLLRDKKQVRLLVLPGEKHIPAGDMEIYYGDVRDKTSLLGFFANPLDKDLIVIHCAGIVSIASKYSQNVYDVNVTGTKNIVDLCREFKVKKLVHVSSVHAIPEKPHGEKISETEDFDPEKVVGLYAKTKAEATKYVLEAAKGGLDASVVHPSGICGPFDYGRGHLTALVMDFYNGRLVAAIDGGYDFVDVRDVAAGVLACCEKGKKGECYILSGKYFTIRQVLYYLHEITGKKEIKSFLPLWFVKATAPLAENYYKIRNQPPLFTAYSIYTLNTNAVFSNNKAREELGYTTRDFKKTLQDTVDWLREKGRI